MGGSQLPCRGQEAPHSALSPVYDLGAGFEAAEFKEDSEERDAEVLRGYAEVRRGRVFCRVCVSLAALRVRAPRFARRDVV
jgi:hypothetical protein